LLLDMEPLERILTVQGWLAAIVGYDDAVVTKKRNVVSFVEKAQVQMSFDLPPIEAIAYMMTLVPMSYERFKSLDFAARSLAFSAVSITDQTIVRRLRDELTDALSSGESLDSFINRVGKLNLVPAKDIETMFRTNIQRAYNVGAFSRGYDLDPNMFPVGRLVAVIDDRTTDICKALHLRYVTRSEVMSGMMIPPFHFNCRTVLEWVDVVSYHEDLESGKAKFVTWDTMTPKAQKGFGKVSPSVLRRAA